MQPVTMVSFCLIIQQSFWLWKRKWASLFGAQRESRQNIRPPSGPRAGRCYQTTTQSKRLFTPTKPLKYRAQNLVHKHIEVAQQKAWLHGYYLVLRKYSASGDSASTTDFVWLLERDANQYEYITVQLREQVMSSEQMWTAFKLMQ